MLIWKIFRTAEWAALLAAGETTGAPVDLADGFIHFSTAEQLPGTLARHFAGAGDLVLAAVEADAAGPMLRWEPARDGSRFPHLYRALRADEIAWHTPLPLDPAGGSHTLPLLPFTAG